MKHHIVVRPEADRDLDDQFAYIARDSLDAAIRFLDASRVTFKQLVAMPELGGRHDFCDSRLTGMRVWQVQGFENYLIFYRPTEMGIEVVRVLHAARDIDAVFGQQL